VKQERFKGKPEPTKISCKTVCLTIRNHVEDLCTTYVLNKNEIVCMLFHTVMTGINVSLPEE